MALGPSSPAPLVPSVSIPSPPTPHSWAESPLRVQYLPHDLPIPDRRGSQRWVAAGFTRSPASCERPKGGIVDRILTYSVSLSHHFL